eukprot:395848-Hanusia_phi.AAC.1
MAAQGKGDKQVVSGVDEGDEIHEIQLNGGVGADGGDGGRDGGGEMVVGEKRGGGGGREEKKTRFSKSFKLSPTATMASSLG